MFSFFFFLFWHSSVHVRSFTLSPSLLGSILRRTSYARGSELSPKVESWPLTELLCQFEIVVFLKWDREIFGFNDGRIKDTWLPTYSDTIRIYQKKKKKNHRNPFSLSKSPWTLRECREIFLLPRKVRKGTKIIICICANDWMSQRFSKFVSLCEAGWMQREVYVAELTREQICNCPITFCIYSLIIYSENYWELLFVIMLSC